MNKTKKKSGIDKRTQRVAAETPTLLEAASVPGLTVALLEDGTTREVLCFGTTIPQGSVPITEQTIFKCASLSKQALLYSALKTIDAGKLDVDQPLALYLDKPFEADDTDLARITVRHVLTHTTGWRNWPPDGELITRIAPLGERWTYSGMGFLYLQEALVSLWNEPATEYLQRLVLDPLDMPQSSFLWRDEYNETAVEGYDPNGDILIIAAGIQRKLTARAACIQRRGSTPVSWRHFLNRACACGTRTCISGRSGLTHASAGPSDGALPMTTSSGSGATILPLPLLLLLCPRMGWALSF